MPDRDSWEERGFFIERPALGGNHQRIERRQWAIRADRRPGMAASVYSTADGLLSRKGASRCARPVS